MRAISTDHFSFYYLSVKVSTKFENRPSLQDLVCSYASLPDRNLALQNWSSLQGFFKFAQQIVIVEVWEPQRIVEALRKDA